MSEEYERILNEPDGYDAARHKVLTVNLYALGNDGKGNVVWYAPYEVSIPLSLNEAWNHYIQHTYMAISVGGF